MLQTELLTNTVGFWNIFIKTLYLQVTGTKASLSKEKKKKKVEIPINRILDIS